MQLERRGHRVTTWDTGTAAPTATGTQAFDVVLDDLGTPDIDGRTVARRVRVHPGGGWLRLLAVSGFSQVTDRARPRAAGFDARPAEPLPPVEPTEVVARRDGD